MNLARLGALSLDEQDILLTFGRPITFKIGSATVLAEFNRSSSTLSVNLAHIDGGGEGVLVSLLKAIRDYSVARGYEVIQWNVHALTCAKPNPRLQDFLRKNGFEEVNDATYGRILARKQML